MSEICTDTCVCRHCGAEYSPNPKDFIENLEGFIEELWGQIDELTSECDEARAEVGRLQHAIRQRNSAVNMWMDDAHDARTERDVLRTERDEARAKLEAERTDFVDWHDRVMNSVLDPAREALDAADVPRFEGDRLMSLGERVQWLVDQRDERIAQLMQERDEVLSQFSELYLRLAKAEQRWIPVEERLPPKSHDLYIVYGSLQGYRSVRVVRQGYWLRTEWSDRLSGKRLEVTHWMPLPSPPEDEE